jgi:hypothetical protein
MVAPVHSAVYVQYTIPNRKIPMVDALLAAVEYYKARHHKDPDSCYLHPAQHFQLMVELDPEIGKTIDVKISHKVELPIFGMMAVATRHVSKGTIQIGNSGRTVKNAEQQPSDDVPAVAESGQEALANSGSA